MMGFGSAPGPNHGVINDGWDGYQAERKELLDFIIDNDIQNVVALTGDIHTFFAGTAGTTGDTDHRPAGRAGVRRAARRPRRACRRSPGSPSDVPRRSRRSNPHITFSDFRHNAATAWST